MEINVFLNSIKQDFIESCNLYHQNQIGNSITIYKDENEFPELDGYELAIIGVEEDRNSLNNKGCKDAPNAIRKSLYQLFNHWKDIKIIDLGNIKTGFGIDDTYFALNKVFMTLMKYRIVPIIIGGSQDLTFPIYQVYENTGKLVNITAIDSRFDIGQDEEELNSNSYLSHIILHKPNFLFNYTNIGYQSYYVDNYSVDLMKQLLFDVHRIGKIKNNIEVTEPLIRNADIVTIDTSAFRAADAPGVKYNSPNGFSSEDGCKMTRYAGLNPKLTSIGFFE
jgi:arginase family enzyme